MGTLVTIHISICYALRTVSDSSPAQTCGEIALRQTDVEETCHYCKNGLLISAIYFNEQRSIPSVSFNTGEKAYALTTNGAGI
jgi:hypothetical protein